MDTEVLEVKGSAGAPHSMYWETPDLFNDAVRKFLAEVYAG